MQVTAPNNNSLQSADYNVGTTLKSEGRYF